jgi:Putative Flp pilus-assembly TadE/G-like
METVMSRRIRQFHQNTDGAMSVLTLLTIWCLVALIGMVWNTAEYAVQRQKLQNSVDSAAYSVATWKARTYNQVTAQNMLIAQDASADIVFRAAGDTQNSIEGELTAELKYLQAIEDGQKQLRSRLPGLLNNINTQYQLLTSALSLVQSDISDGTLTFPDQTTATIYKNQVRQAAYAASWVQSTYVPQLDALAQEAMDTTITEAMLEEARQYIGDPIARPSGTEYGYLQAFEDQIGGAPTNTPELMEQHEEALYQDEQDLVTGFIATRNAQVANIASFYNTNPTGFIFVVDPDSGPLQVLRQSDQVQSIEEWTDQIRVNHPELLRDPDVRLDPINPNTKDNGDSDIVYPQIIVYINGKPATINSNTPGGWGHCWAFPIERYLSTRVSEDANGLLIFMTPIDQLRKQLAQQWAKELGLILNVPPLPGSIPDPQPDPITKRPTTIPILPNLTATGETGGKTDADFAYRRASGAYLAAIRQLINALTQYQGLFNRFTAPYAVPTWYGNLSKERMQVADELGTAAAQPGTTRGFMVLPTYQMYPIPTSWGARSGMQSSLHDAIGWQIYRNNPILWQLGPQGAIALLDSQPFGGPATEISEEMVARQWPYEKAPPQVQVPPSPGISKADRSSWYSVFSIASSGQPGPRTLFGAIFGPPPSMSAMAQGETFNWMEYNDNYGGYYTEKFDEVSLNTFGSLLACPRAWRLSTVGGWNWQARLSVVDSLQNFTDPAPPFRSNDTLADTVLNDLQAGGVTNTDEPISKIILH